MKYLFMGLIKIYKKIISPLFPPCCKYYPTCSSYALEALRKHGFFKGTWLAVWRILRCNPWSMGGIDYVPDKFDILGRHKKD
ncbi:MAG: membrane protein insertion efficiency factor YidD [Oscillospiraceae bacterium]